MVSGSNTGRVLTRLTLDASGYDASSANEIDISVCQKCKAKGIKPKTVTYVFNLTIYWMMKNSCKFESDLILLFIISLRSLLNYVL